VTTISFYMILKVNINRQARKEVEQLQLKIEEEYGEELGPEISDLHATELLRRIEHLQGTLGLEGGAGDGSAGDRTKDHLTKDNNKDHLREERGGNLREERDINNLREERGRGANTEERGRSRLKFTATDGNKESHFDRNQDHLLDGSTTDSPAAIERKPDHLGLGESSSSSGSHPDEGSSDGDSFIGGYGGRGHRIRVSWKDTAPI
jgi:hypothetical protein